ncbi:MAG: hypothetical protein WA667_12690 [Candidatus Nitrosopolaris sp.]
MGSYTLSHSYFHVRIDREDPSNQIVIETDLNESNLLQSIVGPYEQHGNGHFFCNKISIRKYDVRRITILKSSTPYQELVSKLEEKILPTGVKSPDSSWLALSDICEDVTSNLIKYSTNPWKDKKQICLNGHVITSS